MPQDITDDASTLVQVMAWCHQATSHYLSQCWLKSLSPRGVTRPQWVKNSLFDVKNFKTLWYHHCFYEVPGFVFLIYDDCFLYCAWQPLIRCFWYVKSWKSFLSSYLMENKWFSMKIKAWFLFTTKEREVICLIMIFSINEATWRIWVKKSSESTNNTI